MCIHTFLCLSLRLPETYAAKSRENIVILIKQIEELLLMQDLLTKQDITHIHEVEKGFYVTHYVDCQYQIFK